MCEQQAINWRQVYFGNGSCPNPAFNVLQIVYKTKYYITNYKNTTRGNIIHTCIEFDKRKVYNSIFYVQKTQTPVFLSSPVGILINQF